MNILITGIGGLIGGNLARWILKNIQDARVVGVDDYSCGYPENHPKNNHTCWTYEYTLGTSDHVNNIFQRYHFDYVFHLAAYAAEGLSPFIRDYN
jgi:UDP-glucose 4-epimerase